MYVVTALDKRKHDSRNVISIPFKTKQRAESFIKQKRKDNKISILKYRTLHNFTIEKI